MKFYVIEYGPRSSVNSRSVYHHGAFGTIEDAQVKFNEKQQVVQWAGGRLVIETDDRKVVRSTND